MKTATIRALDTLARMRDISSDNRLSLLLDVTRQRVSMYRTGERQLDDDLAIKVAEMIGMKPEQLLAEIQAERSKDAKARKVWTNLARMAAAAPALFAVSVMLDAQTMQPTSHGVFETIAAASSALPEPDTYRTHQNISILDSDTCVTVLLLMMLFSTLAIRDNATPNAARPR